MMCVCVEQRTTCRNRSSPTVWVLELKLSDRCHHSQLVLVYYFRWERASCLSLDSLRAFCSTHFATYTVNMQQMNAQVGRRKCREAPNPLLGPSLLTRVLTLVSQDLCRASSLRAPGADSRKSIRWLSFRRISCTSITPPLGKTQTVGSDENVSSFSKIKLPVP